MESFVGPNHGGDRGGCDKKEKIVYLPVAPHVAAMTRFSSSLPKQMNFLMPGEALVMLNGIMAKGCCYVPMVAITGPGDPLAVPDTTMKTIQLVKAQYPDIDIGLKTLGFGGKRFAKELAEAGVTYVEMQMDAVKHDVLERLYAWIRPGLKTLKISDAVQLLLQEQRAAIPALKKEGINVSIVTTIFPGINADHVQQLSRYVKMLGADSISLIPYEPEKDTEVPLRSPGDLLMQEVEDMAGRYLPVVASRLRGEMSSVKDEPGDDMVSLPLPKPTTTRQNVAVVSSNGMDVNQHLGKATRVLIYGPREDGLTCLLETRTAPRPGSGVERWKEFSSLLEDCFVILAASAGDAPRKALSEYGVRVIVTDENIEGSVDVLYGGSKKSKKK